MELKERKDRLFSDLRRLESSYEIENLMGRCIVAFNFRQADKVLACFDTSCPDVSLEVADDGRFVGPQAVETIVHESLDEPAPAGYMLDMQLTTPIIEIADDLQTARAQWWCPGAGSLLLQDGDPQAIWAWGMLAADLNCTSEGWKIRHLHYFRLIKCDYHKGWVEDTSMINRLNTPMHPLAHPTTWHDPYSPLNVRRGIPAAPRPYATYDGDGWMLNPDKTK